MKRNEMNLNDIRMKVLSLTEMNKVRGGDGPSPPPPDDPLIPAGK